MEDHETAGAGPVGLNGANRVFLGLASRRGAGAGKAQKTRSRGEDRISSRTSSWDTAASHPCRDFEGRERT